MSLSNTTQRINPKILKEYLHTHKSINVQMPNEIFDDLNKNSDLFKTYSHKCFAYSYYYLINYLYRNVVYGKMRESEYNTNQIASIITSGHRKLYYIIKKGGILDSIGYTTTTTNYPVSFYMDNDILTFENVKDVNIERTHSNRFSVKYPVKSFYRNKKGRYLTGTYYDFYDTHKTDVNLFCEIISIKELGYIGFYIHSYLSMMNDKYPEGYKISNKQLSNIVGCSERTIIKYMNILEEEGFIISNRHKYKNKLMEKVYMT